MSTNLDKRESFNDIINFDIIFTQNICIFYVAKKVANKTNSIKINEINLIKVNKIIKKVYNKVNDEISNEISNYFENKIENIFDETNNTNSLNINFASFVANFF